MCLRYGIAQMQCYIRTCVLTHGCNSHHSQIIVNLHVNMLVRVCSTLKYSACV